MAATTLREIKSRNMAPGPLSPLCQSTASNLNHLKILSPGGGATLGQQNTANSNSKFIIERRQAISMERLNSITAVNRLKKTSTNRYPFEIIRHENPPVTSTKGQTSQLNSANIVIVKNSSNINNGSNGNQNINNNNNNGPLSSGSSSSSLIDENCSATNSEDAESTENDHFNSGQFAQLNTKEPMPDVKRNPGLTRSASRVSRFRSAKEFFERLSSSTNSQQVNIYGRSSAFTNNPTTVINTLPCYGQHSFGGSQPLADHQPSRLVSTSSHSNIVSLAKSPERRTQVDQQVQERLKSPNKPNVVSRYTGALEVLGQQVKLTPLKPALPKQNAQDSRLKNQEVPPATPSANVNRLHEDPKEIEQTDTVVQSTTLKRQNESDSRKNPRRNDQIEEQNNFTTKPPINISFFDKNFTPSSFVRLKTHDTSKLSTNTILHINNSHLRTSHDEQMKLSSDDLNGGSVMFPSQHAVSPVLPFYGDNVIINNGSLLVRRNKQLKISFDERSTATFEYPSEETMLRDEVDDGDENNATSKQETQGQQSEVNIQPDQSLGSDNSDYSAATLSVSFEAEADGDENEEQMSAAADGHRPNPHQEPHETCGAVSRQKSK